MRILVVGNLANMGYEITKSLIKSNIDARLLISKYPPLYSDPKFMYPELNKTGYPDWIITYDNKNKSFSKKNWKFQVIKEMRKDYDVIIALTEFSIFAMFARIPYCALSTGSDMRELALEKSIKGFLYRLSYRFARAIIWGEPDKFHLIQKLKIEKKAVFITAPRQIEFKIKNVTEPEFVDKFVLFHPSSQNWKLKKNIKFLEAFIEFCQKHDDVFLIISERGADLKNTKRILSKAGLENKIKFVPPLNARKMQYYYNLCDVVIDQFGIGSMGMITMEAMKLAKPVLVKIDYKLFNKCYNNPPKSISNVKNKEEIFNELERLYINRELCKKIGLENKKWVDVNWDSNKLTKRYIEICKAVKKNDLSFFKNNPKI